MAEIVNAPAEGNVAEVTEPVSDTPEHLQGKSPEDLVSIIRDREKTISRQGEELGSLRPLADQVILQPASSSPQGEAEDVDFYTDPETTVRKIVRQEIGPIMSERQTQRMEQTKNRLDSEHPGWQNMAKGEDFQNWVAGSQFRVSLFKAAHFGDYAAADELFGIWKGLGHAKSEAETEKRKAVDRDRKLRAAKTEKGSAGIDPRKILNRADLRRMRQENPDRYNELLPDIKRAYAEGRVR